MLRMNIGSAPDLLPRYLGTLDLLLWICTNTGSCTDYHTLVFDNALVIRVLCILGSGILYKSNLRRWLRPRQSSTDHQTLDPSIPGRQWHIRGGRFGHALFDQKISLVHNN